VRDLFLLVEIHKVLFYETTAKTTTTKKGVKITSIQGWD